MQYSIDTIYETFKTKKNKRYDEEYHCKLLLSVMLNPKKGTYGAFCLEAMISETQFYNWVNDHETFRDIYYFSKIASKQAWEQEGERIRSQEYQMGTVNYEFEHWKLIGWARHGISKNSKIRVNVNPNDTAPQHYASILKQAADGDFTASEFKQMMEAVNVGMNVYNVFELQKQIDELKSDLLLMRENKDV